MKRLFTIACLLLAFVAGAQPRQSVGLVLSGGGSKGIAHIGVIKALEDNDIPIDYITGTSMGAIVGGLYAAGYTPEEMLDLILSRGFSYWSTGRIDPNLTYYFNRPKPSPTLFSVPVSTGRKPSDVPQSVISPLPMNFAFMELFAPYTAVCGGDFDRLFVPFRCVASDMALQHKIVLGHGDLGDAIRSSMSFPIVFQPTRVDSMWLYDGGIYDNFPFDVMRETFAPSVMFGCTVNTPSQGPQTSLMDQLENLVMRNSDYDLPPSEGIKLHIDLHEFGLLDFPKAREIYQIGYDHAMAVMDSVKARITARTPRKVRELRRAVFRARLPEVRFDSVEVTGGTPMQDDYIRYLFNPAKDCDTIGIDRARDAFYRAISSGKLRDLTAHAFYDDSTGLFSLKMKASVKGSCKIGVGGYISSSTNSFLYASASYSSLSFRSLDASLAGWLGQSVMAGRFGARMYLHTPLPSALDLEAVVSRTKYYETEHLFYDDKTPTFIIDHQYFGRLAWSCAPDRRSELSAGIGYGKTRASYFRNNELPSYQAGRDVSDLKLAQAFVRLTSSTLDDPAYPTAGLSLAACAMGLTGHNWLHGAVETSRDVRWVQGEASVRAYPALGKHFSLGLEADALVSTRKLLPSYAASLTEAPAYTPTPASANAFNPAFRANQFIAAGLVPVYRYNDNLSARLGGYCFLPLRRISQIAGSDLPRYGRWLSHPEAWAEAAVTYKFPFDATLSGYVNYNSAPGDKWHVGLSFGLPILPPSFLR